MVRFQARQEIHSRIFRLHAKQQTRRENYMKKLLLIALVASGLAFVPAQRSDAQISVGIGYPGYGYGYYPYGYYRPLSVLWLLLRAFVLLVRRASGLLLPPPPSSSLLPLLVLS